MSTIRVYVADDHPVVRSGLRVLIDGQPDLSVVGDGFNGEAAVRDAAALRPDVVVMDVSMPGIGGVEATARIRQECPDVRVVALTAHADRGYLHQLLAAGATGYVLKQSAADDLVRAIRHAAAGQMYLDPAVAGQVVGGPAASPTGDAPADDLSDREAEVVRLIAEGYANKQIAARLELSVKTIETYKARAMEKLGMNSRVDIIRYAVRRGWLPAG